MNIGASSAWEYGIYFSWGNTDGHAEGSGYDFSQATYDESAAADIDSDLSLEQDMARANLGQPWRMPKREEWQELVDNCTSVWTTVEGVNGRLFTSNINGNSIFFPASGEYGGTTLNGRGSSGFYWSSSYNSALSAYHSFFDSSNVRPQVSNDRRYGFSVRAVFKP